MKGRFFFSVKKPTQEEKEKLIQLILGDELDKASGLIVKNRDAIAFGELNEGEQFLFYTNKFKYYQPTEESLMSFLNSSDRMIIDNSGNKLSIDDIWELIITNQDKLNNSKKMENASDGAKELFDLDEMEYYSMKHILQYKPLYGEFYNDNLRFSAII